ncbi:hypothetical protein KMAR_40169 [Kluyveromyces marxianus]|nr:hypothetical protein KMAR_40169 [Kluyveromyces marxianus]
MDLIDEPSDIVRNSIDLSIQADENTASTDAESVVTETEHSSDDDYDDVIDEYERQLSDAQREWERSLEQLWQALTWIILPLTGKLLGRRTAGYIWRKVMNRLYS